MQLQESNRKLEMLSEIRTGHTRVRERVDRYPGEPTTPVYSSVPDVTNTPSSPCSSPPPIRIAAVSSTDKDNRLAPRKHYRTKVYFHFPLNFFFLKLIYFLRHFLLLIFNVMKQPVIPAIQKGLLEQIRTGKSLHAHQDVSTYTHLATLMKLQPKVSF